MTLNGIVNTDSDWNVRDKAIRVGQMMCNAEPLIAEYNLTEWMNPGYHGTDVNKQCMPDLKSVYKGLVRV